MKSLNEIIAELESFATAHWQIHTFGHGDVWEISPQSDGIVYPILWMVPQTSTPTLNEVVDEFTVLCMDLVDSGERNETEVLSDTRQIILDVCAYYRQTHTNSYIIEFGGSIEPFTERDPERVSGHSLTIRIKQPHDYNLCAVPANAVPVPPIPSCEPATWILDNTSGTQLSTGEIGSGLSNTIIAPDATYTLENTDGTELSSGSIASGDSEVIIAPDVTVLRDGLAYDTAPSGTTIDVPSNCPAPTYPTTAQLLKTGQTTGPYPNSDGVVQMGRAVAWNVLADPNFFGNTNRFTDTLGGQTYANLIMLDWSTFEKSTGNVLAYYLGYDYTGGGNWDFQMALGHAPVAGFSGWVPANIDQLENLIVKGLSGFWQAPMSTYYANLRHWSSTEYPDDTTRAYTQVNNKILGIELKTRTAYRMIYVRLFNISEL